MERHFDDELKDLRQKLLQMADTAQEMIGLAVKALVEIRFQVNLRGQDRAGECQKKQCGYGPENYGHNQPLRRLDLKATAA